MDKISTTYEIMIIPDVHGRTFWREPVYDALKNTQAKIIFLGDYLDLYWDEFHEEYDAAKIKAISNLKEIIELKKQFPDRITLLLGNHDCTYAISTSICECRTDYAHFDEIRQLFVDNKNLFQLADETFINGRHFIFSHAGINKKYVALCFGDTANEDNVVRCFNDAYKSNNLDVLMSLGLFSRYRGYLGATFGSLVWADAREWDGKKNIGFGFGIVGHTMLSEPIISEELGMAFLDCQKAFVIDNDGNISEFYNESQ